MADWIITTAVGTGEKGFGGDGGPAEKALLNGPFDVVFDGGGNLFFSDTFNNRIRRVDARSGVITTVAGNGEKGFGGDGGPAVRAALNEPYGVVIDRAGNLYIADRLNRRVRRVDAASGVITTVAGTGDAAYGGDGGPGAQAGLAEPNGLAFDPEQTRLYVTDVADNRVRVIDMASGLISTFAGTGAGEHSGDGGPAAAAGTFGARAVKVGADGTVYILERQGSSLRAVDGRGMISTIAGTTARGYSGDGGPALSAVFDAPKEMAIDREGNLLIVDTENHAIRAIDRRTMVVTNLAGGRQGGGGDGGPAGEAGLDRPHGAVVGADGAVWIGDTNNHRVRKMVSAP
jgi:DNA-binding beta-propeller fold protein YncE